MWFVWHFEVRHMKLILLRCIILCKREHWVRSTYVLKVVEVATSWTYIYIRSALSFIRRLILWFLLDLAPIASLLNMLLILDPILLVYLSLSDVPWTMPPQAHNTDQTASDNSWDDDYLTSWPTIITFIIHNSYVCFNPNIREGRIKSIEVPGDYRHCLWHSIKLLAIILAEASKGARAWYRYIVYLTTVLGEPAAERPVLLVEQVTYKGVIGNIIIKVEYIRIYYFICLFNILFFSHFCCISSHCFDDTALWFVNRCRNGILLQQSTNSCYRLTLINKHVPISLLWVLYSEERVSVGSLFKNWMAKASFIIGSQIHVHGEIVLVAAFYFRRKLLIRRYSNFDWLTESCVEEYTCRNK